MKGLYIFSRPQEEPVGECYLCGTPFYAGERTKEHFKRCADENIDAIREHQAERKKRLAVFQEENWDVELQTYLNGVGERMRKEGRLEMKPNERSYE